MEFTFVHRLLRCLRVLRQILVSLSLCGILSPQTSKIHFFLPTAEPRSEMLQHRSPSGSSCCRIVQDGSATAPTRLREASIPSTSLTYFPNSRLRFVCKNVSTHSNIMLPFFLHHPWCFQVKKLFSLARIRLPMFAKFRFLSDRQSYGR